MDARLDVHKILGLEEGEATSSASRSGFFGTQEIILLIHHTDCDMLTSKDDDAEQMIEPEVGNPAGVCSRGFRQAGGRREAIDRPHRGQPVIPNKTSVRGFVCDLKTGRLNEVRAAAGVH